PVQSLKPRAAARAGQAQPRYPQFHRVFEQRQAPDPANGLVVDGRYRLVTARTKALCALYGRQFQHRPGLAAPILLTPIPYAIPLPATQLGHTIHFGHGRPRFVASRTTILPGRPCASLLKWEKNQKNGPQAIGRSRGGWTTKIGSV